MHSNIFFLKNLNHLRYIVNILYKYCKSFPILFQTPLTPAAGKKLLLQCPDLQVLRVHGWSSSSSNSNNNNSHNNRTSS